MGKCTATSQRDTLVPQPGRVHARAVGMRKFAGYKFTSGWKREKKNWGACGRVSLPLRILLMSATGLCSPDIALPIHTRQQLGLYGTLASQKGSFTGTAGM